MEGKCPACKGTERRIVTGLRAAPSGSVRIECAGCRRFIGWGEDDATTGTAAAKNAIPLPAGQPAASLAQTFAERSDLPWWPYCSKKLDLEWVPNVALWAAPLIRFGGAWHWRLSPAVVVWLEAAGRLLEDQAVAGKVGREQLDEYLKVMADVWRFAEVAFELADLAAARVKPPILPEVPYAPAA